TPRGPVECPLRPKSIQIDASRSTRAGTRLTPCRICRRRAIARCALSPNGKREHTEFAARTSRRETPVVMSPGYIPFHPNPSKPTYRPPAGAVDAHCHVFGPESKFPYAPERKYTPCDAPKEKLFALRDFLGFDKNVIVQASCHSKDNRGMIDARERSNGKAKGVAFVGEEVADGELKAMDRAGVRGVRFNFVRRLVDFTPREVLKRIAARVAPLGWHIVVYFEMADLGELEAFFTSLPTTV